MPEQNAEELTTILAQSGEPDIVQFKDSDFNAKIEDGLSTLKDDESFAAFVRLTKAGGLRCSIVGRIKKPGILAKLPGKLAWTVFSDVPWHGDPGSFKPDFKGTNWGIGLRWKG